MFEKLLNQHLIDIEGLFIYHYKKLNLNELQAMTILLVSRLEKQGQSYITPRLLSQYMSVDEKTVDRCVISLLNQQLLSLTNNSLSTEPLLKALLKLDGMSEKKVENKERVNLVQCFEKEFGRGLTPIEIEILKEWKQCQYSDEMILEALKEATLSNVHNMRYIEKILVDWAKHGMKTTGRQTVNSDKKVVDLVEYDWWNEH